MQKFIRLTGIAAPLPRENINTDAIIPAQLIRTASKDLGGGLFARWRYEADGREVEDFILNRPPFRNAKIIVGGANFGCGSSREAAVWALEGFGIRCVIAESFSDIFFENAFKNGLLAITLPAGDIQKLFGWLAAANDPTLDVDLERCIIAMPNGTSIPFKVASARRNALLEGLDEVGQTLALGQQIDAFQQRDRIERPWVYVERPVLALARDGEGSHGGS